MRGEFPAMRFSPTPPLFFRPRETKRAGESRSRVECQANKFSSTKMPLVRSNIAPKSGRISRVKALVAPRVRIHLAPPHSLACFPTLWRSDEIGVWGAIHARPWTRRVPMAAAERENRLKFSVRDFSRSIDEPADIFEVNH
jgi:hypothetical protein